MSERPVIEQSGRPPSQNEQILAVLADGNWHSARNIHASVFCVLHSRISELRQRGYLIEHRGGGAGAENHEYRLQAATSEAGSGVSQGFYPGASDGGTSLPASDAVVADPADGPTVDPSASDNYVQLTLAAVA